MTLRQQVFTSPGTWVHPGDAQLKYVDVLLVGGGGGSKTTVLPNPPSGIPVPVTLAGGGGGVRFATGIPVSGPTPVTVGAGGSSTPSPSGSAGGDSSFGSTTVGGGGAGGTSAPPNGGGSGQGFNTVSYPISAFPTAINNLTPGSYGAPNYLQLDAAGAGGVFSSEPWNPLGLGSGGCQAPSPSGYGSNRTNVIANTGAGASVGPTTMNGASGLVVVRWFE